MQKMLFAAALSALAFAGVASAYGLKTIMVSPGHCTTVKKTRVCARNSAVRYRTVTETDQTVVTTTITAPTVTVTAPVVTVTQPSVVTTPVPAPPATTTTTSCAAVVEDFSGNGDLTEAPFTTCKGETLSWTWQNTNGDFPTGMSIFDDSGNMNPVSGDGNTTSGSTYVPAGTHTLAIITTGNWTIHVGP